MRKVVFFLCVLAGCAAPAPDVRHLSPQFKPTEPPHDCRIIGVLKNSPAEHAGLKVGDKILGVNGKVPENASSVGDLIASAPAETNLDVGQTTASSQTIHVTLNAQHPRLGALCDLNGWSKSGLSQAGNESETIFQGPYAVTLSGVVDEAKQLMLLRAHLVNHSDESVHVGSDLFSAQDGAGKSVPVLTPTQVMCVLYGEKGARILNQQAKHHASLDTDTAPGLDTNPEGSACEGLEQTGRLSRANSEYVQQNAKSVAEDSLWPTLLATEETVDGLIYLMAPAALPVTITLALPGQTFHFQLGTAQASTQIMPAVSLQGFFEAQKRGTPMRVTLKKGNVFIGKFLTYDSVEEMAWFEAPAESLLNSVSYPLRSIRAAEKLDQQN